MNPTLEKWREVEEEKIKANTWKEAASEIKSWSVLLKHAHSAASYTNDKDAEREHQNTMRLLATLHSSFLKHAGVPDQERFRVSQEFCK